MIELAVPTTRDLERLPDGSTLEFSVPGLAHVTRIWRARPARVPWVRWWEHELADHNKLLATSSILATQIWALVLDHGDVAVPLVVLPAGVRA